MTKIPKQRPLLWLLLGCLWLLPRVAHGQPETIVLESNVGEGTRASGAVYELLWRMMPRDWVTDPARLLHALREHLPAQGQKDARYTGALFVRDIKNASAVWSRADFDGALKLLNAAIKSARENPVILVQDVEARNAMRQGLMLLALVQRRMATQAKDAEAFAPNVREKTRLQEDAQRWSLKSLATLAEVVRSFPDMPVRRDEFGGEAERFYLTVAHSLAQLPTGSLEIAFTEPTGMLVLSLNEMLRPPGLISQLSPGRYRVLVQALGGKREYQVEVKSGQLTRLRIDWRVDAVLSTTGGVGFQWPTADAQAGERDVVRRLMGYQVAARVATFAVESQGRKSTIVGTLYTAGGMKMRRARVVAEAGHGAPLQRLVDFLERGVRVDGLDVLSDEIEVRPPALSGGVPRPAVVAAQYENDANSSVPAAAVGVPASRSRLLPALLIGGGAGAVIFGGVLYYYGSQPPPADSSNQATLFGSKPAGIATGVAGLAAMGVGWWLWPHSVSSGAARVALDVHASGASVGVMGSF